MAPSQLTLAFVALAASASAGEERASSPWRLVESAGVSYNRLGVQHVIGLSWTKPLSASRRPLMANAHLALGGAHTLTPSYTRLAAWAEIAPVSVLELRATVEPTAYFGTFGSLASFGRYDSDFSDAARDRRERGAQAGTAIRTSLSPTMKLRAGSMAWLTEVTLECWRASPAGPLFYEPARDTLLKTGGDRLLAVSSALVRQAQPRGGGQVTYGVSYEWIDVPAAPGNRTQKVGAVCSHRRTNPRARGLPSSIALRVAYYLDHPSRRGEWTAALGLTIDRLRRDN